MLKSNDIKHYFPELDILSYADDGIRELMIKVNFAYNQVDRLDARATQMLNESPEGEKWGFKWKNINEQRGDYSPE